MYAQVTYETPHADTSTNAGANNKDRTVVASHDSEWPQVIYIGDFRAAKEGFRGLRTSHWEECQNS
jgi:hypothetical protein